MEVIETEDVFSHDLGEHVGIKGHSSDKRNWRRDGWVVLNGKRGKAVDIFYGLEKSNRDGQIVVTDQRRAASGGALAATKLKELIEKARITPSTVVCLFSCLSSSRLEREDIPRDSCLVSHVQTIAYHGALWVHPAASPCIDLNSASIGYLKMVFKGEDADEFCRKIMKRRDRRRFRTMEEVENFISAMKKKLQFSVSEDDVGRIIVDPNELH